MNRVTNSLPSLQRGALVALISLAGLLACSKPEPVAKPPQDVQVYRVGNQIEGSQRDFPAVIQANNLSKLSFRVAGELIMLPATSGMRVKKGDLLASIDPADYRRRVIDTEEAYKLAQLNFGRAQKLMKTGAISASEHDQLQAKFLIAEADYKLAQKDLRFTELRAPKDGTVGNVLADNFQSVKVGQPILTLYDPDTLEVQVNVSEQLLALAKSGKDRVRNEFIVTFESLPGKSFTAYSYEFETEKDPKTKSYRASLLMNKPTDVAILPGMSAVVSVDMSKIERHVFAGIVLPSSAVLYQPDAPIDGNGTFVWKLSDDGKRVTRQAVQTRRLGKTGVELRGGIKPGDVVVTYGQQQLFEGALINVVSDKENNG